MARRLREVIIPKEKVSFWLDQNGFWHNENERFENQRIINYFHSCIKKDDRGFHLAQRHRDYIEKAFFSYEDTALFVFDVIKREQARDLLRDGVLSEKGRRSPSRPHLDFLAHGRRSDGYTGSLENERLLIQVHRAERESSTNDLAD